MGYNERFIRPVRELTDLELSCEQHLRVVGEIFAYTDENDAQAVELQNRLVTESLDTVIKDVTGVTDEKLLIKIKAAINAVRNIEK